MEISTIRFVMVFFCITSISACANNGDWGNKTTFRPGWHRIKQAARNAVKDPHTWIPLASAAVFGMGNNDQKVVDWADKHHPLFGNREDAIKASDRLDDLATANYYITVIAVPSGPGGKGFWNKVRGLGVGLMTIQFTDHVTGRLKTSVGRQRPDGSGNTSFPSRHTSGATTASALASRNIDYMHLTYNQRLAWKVTSYSFAGLTGWARVEGKKHYPSDVLAAYALGNFIGKFMNDAFIAPRYRDKIGISVMLGPDKETIVSFTYRW